MLSAFKLARTLLLCLAALPLVACDDELGLGEWTSVTDSVTLYSLSREDLIGKPSAYDLVNHVLVQVELAGTTGTWDVALRHEGNQLVLVPAGGFQGQVSRAGLALISNTTFEELRQAPSDTAAFSSAPVAVQVGQVYAFRTRRAPCSFSNAGVRYGKLKIVDVNPTAGTLRFASITNPFCNDRALIPEDSD